MGHKEIAAYPAWQIADNRAEKPEPHRRLIIGTVSGMTVLGSGREVEICFGKKTGAPARRSTNRRNHPETLNRLHPTGSPEPVIPETPARMP
ncbi:hypothetical protein CYPRO_1114 [Cyclonatronum proteinivorum]|uniref:Uncharacterized protein n=1 Tax=Cyclonatronum proteinivorum TaxID=1457365 RepID=A0A345UIS7_9BACT|nr:hypothetical protein CYPRO_1114 [Cyclonatronum proteinivorum]